MLGHHDFDARSHPYPECGLDNVRVVGLRQDDDGALVMPNANLVHQELAQAVATKSSRLSGKEVRFLRTENGWTRSLMATCIGVGVEQVTACEEQDEPLDEEAERALRMETLRRIGKSDASIPSTWLVRPQDGGHTYHIDLQGMS